MEGRKEGKKEERKKERKKERKNGRKEERKEERKEGRTDVSVLCSRVFPAILKENQLVLCETGKKGKKVKQVLE